MLFANAIQSPPNSLTLKMLNSSLVNGCLIFSSSSHISLFPSCLAHWAVTTSTKMSRAKFKVKYSNRSVSDWVNTCGQLVGCFLCLRKRRRCLGTIRTWPLRTQSRLQGHSSEDPKQGWRTLRDEGRPFQAGRLLYLHACSSNQSLTSRWKQLRIWGPKTAILNEPVIHRTT